uniref:Uncharacterized protein n=1 Tax=Plectus sambesii TaxID=2011161 RepID=A0A914UPL1_9BILA
MDIAVASTVPSQLHSFDSPSLAYAATFCQRAHQQPQPQPSSDIICVVYTVNTDYSVWRQVVSKRMEVLQCTKVGQYTYLASQEQRVFVNVPWTTTEPKEAREHHYYAAHRSHTPCAFNRIINREPVRDQWQLLLDKLDRVRVNDDGYDGCDENQTDSPAVKRLRSQPT